MTPEQRHRCMAAIKGKDTKPEIIVRKYLFSRGLRYRINNRKLPGSPDIVLKKYRTVVFIDGCFWHGHEGCKYFRLPKSNVDFWRHKIAMNIVLIFLKMLYSFDNRSIITIFALSHCCRFAAIELRRAKGWQMRLE